MFDVNLKIYVQKTMKTLNNNQNYWDWMTKTEQIYKILLKKKVVNTNDTMTATEKIIKRPLSRAYVHNEYLHKLLQQKRLVRIRKGLYLVLDPLEGPASFIVDKIQVGSKIRRSYYLGYHTALEFHGCAYSSYNEVYVCISKKDRFNAFECRGLHFVPVFTEDIKTDVDKRKYLGVQVFVSSPERTFTDCISKPGYAGGWEECMKSLEGLSGINKQKIYRLLCRLDVDFLYRKTGLILEMLRKSSVHYEWVNDSLLAKIKTHIGVSPMYVERKPSVLNKKWNLYVPKNFENLLRGV